MADNEGKKGSAKGKRVPEARQCPLPSRFQGQKAQDVSPIWRKTTNACAMSLNGD